MAYVLYNLWHSMTNQWLRDKLNTTISKIHSMSGQSPRPDPPKHLLALPFSSASDFKISEGWLYSEEEHLIHGHALHYGIDFAAQRGTSVYAAANGFAIASSQIHIEGQYQGKQMGYGLGTFIQIWHPEYKIFTLYSHLQEASPKIIYLEPEKQNNDWVPEFLKKPNADLLHLFVPVRCGDLIGSVGDSGLSWGYEEVPERKSSGHSQPSWDETHLHFEIFTRDAHTSRKQARYDPYGVYGSREAYQDLSNFTHSAWILSDKGTPIFAVDD